VKIKIRDGLEIGEGLPPFIIAEIGSNWRTLEDCLTSISQAKACGANAVKFQLFDSNALYGITSYDFNEHNALPIEWLPKLKEKADAVGVEFMCSAFSPELIDVVDAFVNIHKVASAECTHLRMLERLRDIGKPVILSTGAHGFEDIKMALSVLENTPTVLMYCVAAYPARRINLGIIDTLRKTFNRPVGYSDHSTDVLEIPLDARAMGACVIEKHVQFVEGSFPDSPHSLNGDDFQAMVESIYKDRSLEIAPTPEERPMVLRHNRRLIAMRDIKPGDVLNENENFGIYRSLKDDTHAFHPFMVDEVDGKIALREIKAGDGIGPGDV
jgi:N,N'-diacetyllegionaminate synthase